MKGIGLMVNSMELEYLSKKTVVDVEVFGKTVKELKINHKIIKSKLLISNNSSLASDETTFAERLHLLQLNLCYFYVFLYVYRHPY